MTDAPPPVSPAASADQGADDQAAPSSGGGGGRPVPLVPRWIRSLPQWLYASLLVGIFVVLVVITMLVNPGHEVGPVQPAKPPVGGPGLPATRL